MINDSGGMGKYKQTESITWSTDELEHGKMIKIRKFPENKKVKLFRITVSTNRTDYVATNDISQNSACAARDECRTRWKVEEFHREVKQVTGIERCQCRIGRIQRNHIACAILVWTCLKRAAYKAGTTIYQIKKNFMRDYLVQELISPKLAFA